MYFSKCISLLSMCLGLSGALPQQVREAPLSRACGEIVNSPEFIFTASLAYECLTSVPFNPAVATRFLDYYSDTLQFQSTLSYLKSPPPSYQQPGVDLLKGLEDLKKGVQEGIFPNQYEFEAALQTLLYAAHDGHVTLSAGILQAFSFASPYDLVTLSKDGIEIPKVYLTLDFSESEFFTAYTPSPIVSINGEETVAYLKNFAAKNSYGMVEPHGDWNKLMRSAAQDFLGDFSVFGGDITFYPGDTITFVLENGTSITEDFIALFYSPGSTGPLETGGDFYNFFVLNLLPASYDPDLIINNTFNISASIDASSESSPTDSPTATASDSAASATSTDSTIPPACTDSRNNDAYPTCPDVSQHPGTIDGYFLNDSSIAVLSLPSFDFEDESLASFDSTIEEFLTRSRNANLKRVVIDVQQNTGGKSLLAIAAFKHFFPNIDPFAGSRLRAHPAADKMGQAFDFLFQALLDETGEEAVNVKAILDADEFVSHERINANTGKLFSTWVEFFGPNVIGADQYTTTQHYNLSDTLFDNTASLGDDAIIEDLQGNFTVYGYGINPATSSTPPYAAENIIILSDGACSSSCALFLEMMHHEAGVRIVVAGGQPTPGPMQSSSTRGAASYTVDTLDAHIEFAQEIYKLNDTDVYFLPPNRTEASGIAINVASINLRDQVRKDDTTPLQFAYEAADCRIWYTPQTLYNYTMLWKYAADSIWGSKDLCVSGSKGYSTTGTNKTDFVGPVALDSSGTVTVKDIVSHLTSSGITKIPYLNDGLEDAPTSQKNSGSNTPKLCASSKDCASDPNNNVCVEITTCVSGFYKKQKQCTAGCPRDQDSCSGPNNNKCQFKQNICTDASKPCAMVSATTFPVGGKSTTKSNHAQPGVCLPTLQGPVVEGQKCQAQQSGGVQTAQGQLGGLKTKSII